MSLPFTLSEQPSPNNFSVTSRQSCTRASAQEVYEHLYGTQRGSVNLDAAFQRIYEANASAYENPLLTATSRTMIADIYRAAQSWCEIDMPRPWTMLSSLFRCGGRGNNKPRSEDGCWFRILRVWSEVGEICEAESFDGHRKSIVEHTLHFLVLPGIHSGRGPGPRTLSASDSSLDIIATHLYSVPHFQRTSQPSLALPGTQLCWPSPLHFELRIHSRLEFNGERVTHHRDIWDVKDLVALVPGAKLAQYIGTRLAARALVVVGKLSSRLWGASGAHFVDTEETSWNVADNSLGLLGVHVKTASADVEAY